MSMGAYHTSKSMTFVAEGYSELNGTTPEEEAAHNQNGERIPPRSVMESGIIAEPLSVEPHADVDEGLLVMNEESGVLRVSGDIDLYQAATFRTRAEEYVASVATPILDLRNVSFIDSAGLAVLLMLSRHAKLSEKILTVLATGAPRRVLRITGIDQAVKVMD